MTSICRRIINWAWLASYTMRVIPERSTCTNTFVKSGIILGICRTLNACTSGCGEIRISGACVTFIVSCIKIRIFWACNTFLGSCIQECRWLANWNYLSTNTSILSSIESKARSTGHTISTIPIWSILAITRLSSCIEECVVRTLDAFFCGFDRVISLRARETLISCFVIIRIIWTGETRSTVPIRCIQRALTTTGSQIVDFTTCALDLGATVCTSIKCLSSRASLTATWIYIPIFSWVASNAGVSIPIGSDWAFKALLSGLIPKSSSGATNTTCWTILIMRSLRASHYYSFTLVCGDGIFKPNITVITSFFCYIIKLSTFTLFACKSFFIPEAWVWTCITWLTIEIRGLRGALALIRSRIINLSNWTVCNLRG